MKISALKSLLSSQTALSFLLPDGTQVPAHFHLTELGLISKKSMDCGGQLHQEEWATLQLWVADDTDHRLSPARFMQIISDCEPILEGKDLDIEVEYQNQTIGKFDLGFDNGNFLLLAKHTDCRAKELCTPAPKTKITLADLPVANGCCSPQSNCCS